MNLVLGLLNGLFFRDYEKTHNSDYEQYLLMWYCILFSILKYLVHVALKEKILQST